MEARVTSLSGELKKEASTDGWLFMSNEEKSWSDSRQYCKDHGADLVIINSEEKQTFISSFTKEKLWIGLSDIQQEGRMKWVDNSPLNRGSEPEQHGGPGPSRSEERRQAQKASVAIRAPPSPAGGSRRKHVVAASIVDESVADVPVVTESKNLTMAEVVAGAFADKEVYRLRKIVSKIKKQSLKDGKQDMV
ncbi:CD209 antigen-like protein [Labeo rohita]|uniref:CD209 antigen-like protein n=1 Tax=Labeo rohita TaxID=84645 RepID=A0A498M1F8_LABRO|nr:CD209 antigen-like protein [Labeo rohita]